MSTTRLDVTTLVGHCRDANRGPRFQPGRFWGWTPVIGHWVVCHNTPDLCMKWLTDSGDWSTQHVGAGWVYAKWSTPPPPDGTVAP